MSTEINAKTDLSKDDKEFLDMVLELYGEEVRDKCECRLKGDLKQGKYFNDPSVRRSEIKREAREEYYTDHQYCFDYLTTLKAAYVAPDED